LLDKFDFPCQAGHGRLLGVKADRSAKAWRLGGWEVGRRAGEKGDTEKRGTEETETDREHGGTGAEGRWTDLYAASPMGMRSAGTWLEKFDFAILPRVASG
jgi:hypothetical protein